jgi:excisionase family DNA binding protein
MVHRKYPSQPTLDTEHRVALPRPNVAMPPAGPLAYRVTDAARALGIGKTSLYALFNSGTLTPIRIGGRTLVPADQLRRLVSEAQPAISPK